VGSKDTKSVSLGSDARRPTDLDRRIGRLIRERRQSMQLTIDDLARELTVTPHQLQKYETGENRISASRLVECARALEVHVAWFYQSVGDTGGKATENQTLNEQEQMLLASFRALTPASRRQLSDIAGVLCAPVVTKKRK
jgi:transcriptional regulator with XRE-family HTH domain